MKFLDPDKQALLPALISVREDTAYLLCEMATELEVSLDELLSGLAEEAVLGLSKDSAAGKWTVIPDSCSTADLDKLLKKHGPF